MNTLHFVCGIFISLGIAFVLPDPGSPGGFLAPSYTGAISTFLIFLIQGIQLKKGALRELVKFWPLHVGCQCANFIFAPVVFFILAKLSKPFIQDNSIFMGMLFLGMLPTTINSAIAMVQMAAGHAPSAILNSSVSNVLGVFIMPIWINFWMDRLGELTLRLAPVFLKLFLLILLPVFVGRIIGQKLKIIDWAEKGKQMKLISMYLIFLIVYFSFCRSVKSNVWSSIDLPSLAFLTLFVLLGLFTVHLGTWYAGKFLKFSESQLPVFLFCGSQKTLAAGIPLATAMLSQKELPIDPGLFLIPIMIYHPLQMIVGGRWIYILNQRSL